MKVLVTGGAGFIGSHLVDRLLADGHAAVVLDSLVEQVHRGGPPAYLNRDAELIEGDVRDPAAVRRALEGADRVVHLAAAVGVGQSMYEVARYCSVNTVGAATVLEEAAAVRDRVEKLVVASSMSIYGEGLYRCPAEGREVAPGPRTQERLEGREWEPPCPSCGAPVEALPTPESKTLDPASVYAITKRDHEELFIAWGRAYGVPATALRLFNVFGTRQSLSNPYTGVAAIFASRLLNGRPPGVFEDGLQRRDFVHVADVVDALVAALQPGSGDGAALNVGSGRPVTVLDVAAALARGLGVEIEPEIRSEFRAGDVRHCFPDISLARRGLGFEPSVGFDEGMAELVGWLAGEQAEDHVPRATEELRARGLTT
jgi:dTDP-L-rhamnose 4-epimerase